MMMTVFDYEVYAKGDKVAGFEDLQLAAEYAKSRSAKDHCNAVVINAFTGELLYEANAICHLTVKNGETIEKTYKVIEEWVGA